jgi:hypothetical protein
LTPCVQVSLLGGGYLLALLLPSLWMSLVLQLPGGATRRFPSFAPLHSTSAATTSTSNALNKTFNRQKGINGANHHSSQHNHTTSSSAFPPAVVSASASNAFSSSAVPSSSSSTSSSSNLNIPSSAGSEQQQPPNLINDTGAPLSIAFISLPPTPPALFLVATCAYLLLYFMHFATEHAFTAFGRGLLGRCDVVLYLTVAGMQAVLVPVLVPSDCQALFFRCFRGSELSESLFSLCVSIFHRCFGVLFPPWI